MDKKMWIFTGCGNCVKGYYPTGSNDLHCLDTKKVVDEYGEFPPWCPIPNSTVAAIEAKNAELVAEINSVKALHNGYDPECRAAMPTLKKPASLKGAVESLLEEADIDVIAAIDKQVDYEDRAARAEEMARVFAGELEAKGTP